MKIYVLYCSYGHYEDYRRWVQGVYATRELAEAKKKEIVAEYNQENEVLTKEQFDKIEEFIDIYSEGCWNDEEKIIDEHFPDVEYDDYVSFYTSLSLYDDYYEPEIEEVELIEQ